MSPVTLLDRTTTEPPARPPEPGPEQAQELGPTRTRAALLRWESPILAEAGVLLWASSLGRLHPYGAGQLGLLPQLPATWWLGLVLVLAAVLAELLRPSPRPAAAVLAIGALALVLHGTLPAVEPTPRFSAAYEIAGFAQYVEQHGRTLPDLDARMSWPGMLSAAGLLGGAMGVPAIWFVRWAPLVFNLAYLLPVKAIADATLRTPRARWAALPAFLVANWIDQDYFSPQAVGLLLYLVVLAIVVRTFPSLGTQPAPLRHVIASAPYRSVASHLRAAARLPQAAVGEGPPDVESATGRAALGGLALLLTLAVVVSHQFTPLALVVVLLCLALLGRTALPWLWLFVLAATFAWLSWEAETYWAGHLSTIFGNVGNAGALIGGGVTGRVRGVPGGRLVVQWARLAATGTTAAGAAAGFLVLWRRGRTHWSMAVLAAAPALVALGVNYGGEIFLRILLFSLAPCAVLVAGFVDAARPRPRAVAAALGVLLVLAGLFPLARYGNESFEAIAPGDLAAARWVVAHVPPGATVWVANGDNPLDGLAAGRLRVETAATGEPSAGRRLAKGDWLYLSRSQGEYAVSNQGYPAGNWVRSAVAFLVSGGSVRIVHRTATADVLEVTAPTVLPLEPKAARR